MRLSDAVRLLSDAGVENPRHDAREIFMRIGNIPQSELLFPDTECSLPEVALAIERRKSREPLQYIIGEVDFYREKYTVTPDCLIPREDTEILVDYAVKHIPEGKRLLDLCTGSGCVGISTVKNTKSTSAVALDISSGALSLAKKNAEENGVADRVEFMLADALSVKADGEFYAILSNPPYVTETAYESLEKEIYFEPKIAFVGGCDGLDFYRGILSLYKNSLSNDGFFAFEIGYDQGAAITRLAAEHGMSAQIIKDLSNNDRVAVIKHP